MESKLEQLATQLTGKPDLHILGLLMEIGQDEQPLTTRYSDELLLSDDYVSTLSGVERKKIVEVAVSNEAARRWRLLVETGQIIQYANH